MDILQTKPVDNTPTVRQAFPPFDEVLNID
jgi:hypothetical protein